MLDKSSYIRGISLAGFQVFDELTEIPFDRLTLLFGPNSAGKSAIEDALRILQILMSAGPGDFGQAAWNPAAQASIVSAIDTASLARLKEEFRKSWRRTGQDGAIADELRLHIRASMALNPCLAAIGRLDAAATASTDAELQFRFFQQDGDKWTAGNFSDEEFDFEGLCFGFSVWVDSEIALAYDHADWLTVLNIKHPSLASYAPASNFRLLSDRFAEHVKWEEGAIAFHMLPGFRLDGWEATESGAHAGFLPVLEAESKDEAYAAAVREFSDLFGRILIVVHHEFRVAVTAIPASRQIPTEKELTFMEGKVRHSLDLKSSPFFESLGALVVGVNIELPAVDIYGVLKDAETLDKVNEYLADHLFTEKGYRIDRKGYVLISEDDFEATASATSRSVPRHGSAETFKLKDAQARTFSFQDVGSGLGYVLPVLCAIADGRSISRLTFIQQPELHLHPALQAELQTS